MTFFVIQELRYALKIANDLADKQKIAKEKADEDLVVLKEQLYDMDPATEEIGGMCDEFLEIACGKMRSSHLHNFVSRAQRLRPIFATAKKLGKGSDSAKNPAVTFLFAISNVLRLWGKYRKVVNSSVHLLTNMPQYSLCPALE